MEGAPSRSARLETDDDSSESKDAPVPRKPLLAAGRLAGLGVSVERPPMSLDVESRPRPSLLELIRQRQDIIDAEASPKRAKRHEGEGDDEDEEDTSSAPQYHTDAASRQMVPAEQAEAVQLAPGVALSELIADNITKRESDDVAAEAGEEPLEAAVDGAEQTSSTDYEAVLTHETNGTDVSASEEGTPDLQGIDGVPYNEYSQLQTEAHEPLSVHAGEPVLDYESLADEPDDADAALPLTVTPSPFQANGDTSFTNKTPNAWRSPAPSLNVAPGIAGPVALNTVPPTGAPNTPPMPGGVGGNVAPPVGNGSAGGGFNAPPFNPNFGAYGVPPLGGNAAAAMPNFGPPMPNILNNHEHRHGHPKMAAIFLGGLLAEHIFRKRADRKLDAKINKRSQEFAAAIKKANAESASQASALRSVETSIGAAPVTMAAVGERGTMPAARVEAPIVSVSGERQQPNIRETFASPVRSAESATIFSRTMESGQASAPKTVEVPISHRPEARRAEKISPAALRETLEAAPVAAERLRQVMLNQAEVAKDPMGAVERAIEYADSAAQPDIVIERRHEVKDEPGGGAQLAGGTVPAANHWLDQHETLPAAATSRQLAETQAQLAVQQGGSADEGSYKDAAKVGFWGAVVVIVLGIIAYVATR